MLLRRKKALAFSTIIAILVVIASFIAITFVITHFFGRAEAATAETVCRASVVARERTTQQITVKGYEVAEVQLTPLLCRTIGKDIPQKKDAKKEDVMREFAESMVRCWWMFGDGLIDDVFKEGSPTTNNCFMCHVVVTGKTNEFKEEISRKEFSEFLMETPYKIAVESDRCKNLGGHCAAEGGCTPEEGKWKYDKDNIICKRKDTKKPGCCHSSYSCWNSGGKCEEEKKDYPGFVEYDKWDCPSKETCYIEDKNYVTYARYIQSYNGDGNIIITTPIKPEEVYAVSFGSPTTNSCDFCFKWGIATGVGFMVLTAATISTGGLALPLAIGAVAGLTEYVSSKTLANIFSRNTNTIYLTTLDEATSEERCNLIESVEGKGGEFGGGSATGLW